MNQCVDRSSLVQAGQKITFMGVNLCKEVHWKLNYGVELEREDETTKQICCVYYGWVHPSSNLKRIMQMAGIF
jgi:hypothetical protein